MTEDNNADDGDDFEYHAQVTHHPVAEVTGEVVDVVTSANIDSEAEQTGHGIGVVFEDPELTSDDGSVWASRNSPDGFDTVREYNDTLELANADVDEDDYAGGEEVTEANVNGAREELEAKGYDYEDADEVSCTDYKLASEGFNDVQKFDGNIVSIDVGGGAFEAEPNESFDHDRVMVWYGGVTGQFLARALDFNGLPFARYTEDGYLVKGLLQVPLGWRGNSDIEQHGEVPTTDRSKLARSEDRGGLGRAPRLARPLILRPDIEGERISVEIDDNRFITITGESGDELDLRNGYDGDGSVEDYIEDALDVDDANTVYEMYHGEGWEPQPADDPTEATDTSGGSFDVDADDGNDEGEGDSGASLSDAEEQFASKVVEALTGTDAAPSDEVFGEDGLTMRELGEAQIENFDTDSPNFDAIEAYVYEHSAHLEEEAAPAA